MFRIWCSYYLDCSALATLERCIDVQEYCQAANLTCDFIIYDGSN